MALMRLWIGYFMKVSRSNCPTSDCHQPGCVRIAFNSDPTREKLFNDIGVGQQVGGDVAGTKY